MLENINGRHVYKKGFSTKNKEQCAEIAGLIKDKFREKGIRYDGDKPKVKLIKLKLVEPCPEELPLKEREVEVKKTKKPKKIKKKRKG